MIKVKDFIKLLEDDGWVMDRIKGDHRMFVKDGAKRPIVVSGHLNDELLKRTLSSLKREAGIK